MCVCRTVVMPCCMVVMPCRTVVMPCCVVAMLCRWTAVQTAQTGTGTCSSLSSRSWTQFCLKNITGVCNACNDGVQNGGESDIDCGGTSSCRACITGQVCTRDSDCTPGRCATNHVCYGT